jgi:uncharacterized membrane protein (DUF485 family)
MNAQGLPSRRWRIVAVLSAPLIAFYVAFVLLIAFTRNAAAILVVPGVTLALLLAALLIVGTWLTTWLYVRWANRQLAQQARPAHTGKPA